MTNEDPKVEGESGLTLTEHLRELRTRVIRSLIGIVIASIICYNFIEDIIFYIRMPIQPYIPTGGLHFTAPADKFMAYLKVAFFSGVVVSTPWWLYQVWRFIAPGLYAKEKKYSLGFIFVGSLLFAAGVAFCYLLALPAAFEFLMTFGGSIDTPMITIDNYLSFFITMLVVFGFTFELPLIIVVLGMMGLVSQQFLREKRRYIIVILSIAAAILTPSPDLISMLTLMVPLYILFEISVFIVGFFERNSAEGEASGRGQT